MSVAGRATILPVLALASASTDVISYLGLGHVFTANMTGNTALLGIGIASAQTGAVLRSVCALGGFVLGAAASQVFAGHRRALASCLAAETLPLAAWFVWWQAGGDPAHGLPRYGYIVLAGIAMGLQSGAVTRLGVRGVTTVFITGTLTSLTVGLTGRLRGGPPPRQDPPDHVLQGLVVVFFLAGALAGGYAFRHWGGTAAVVPLGIVAVVMAAAFVRPPEREG
ncbi:YoaK family protein [Spirillospora sp. NPDC047418]